MEVVALEAEHFARQMKRADLAPSIGKPLGDADDAGRTL